MDLVIVIALLAVVIFIYKNVHFVVYLLGVLEIFFRLIHYIGDNIPFLNMNPFINKYIPTSLFSIISKYTTGVVEIILSWLLVLSFVMLLIYLVKYLFKIK